MDSLEHILCCNVCLKEFEESGDHTPRLLQCSHTLCERCIKQLIHDNKIDCPECRTRHEAKNEEKSFTQNKFLLSQIKHKVTGKQCQEHGEELILWCREETCRAQICRLCVREHQKHQIVDIEEEIKDAITRKVDGIVNILEARMKLMPTLQENLKIKNVDCVEELEIKREEINNIIDTMITQVKDQEKKTRNQIGNEISVIKGKLALLHNLKQDTAIGKDLKYKDLVNNKEGLRIIAENIDKLMAETGSYKYPEFEASTEPVENVLGSIREKEMLVSVFEQKDQERKNKARAEQIKCEGKIFKLSRVYRRYILTLS